MSGQTNITEAGDGKTIEQTAETLSADAPAPQSAACASLDAPSPQIVITEATPLLQSQASPSVDEVACSTSGNVPASTTVPDSSASSSSIKQNEQSCEDESGVSKEAKDSVPSADAVLKPAEVSTFDGVQDTEAVEERVAGIDGAESGMAEDIAPSRWQRLEELSSKIFVACCEKLAVPLMSTKAIPVWFAFLFLPVSAAVLGGLYLHSCPERFQFPASMLGAGILGSTMITAQITWSIRSIWYREKSSFSSVLKKVRDITAFLTAVMLIAATTVIWTLNPDFLDSSSPKFCDRFFYDFSVGLVYVSWIITIPVATALIEYRWKRSLVVNPA